MTFVQALLVTLWFAGISSVWQRIYAVHRESSNTRVGDKAAWRVLVMLLVLLPLPPLALRHSCGHWYVGVCYMGVHPQRLPGRQ